MSMCCKSVNNANTEGIQIVVDNTLKNSYFNKNSIQSGSIYMYTLIYRIEV